MTRVLTVVVAIEFNVAFMITVIMTTLTLTAVIIAITIDLIAISIVNATVANIELKRLCCILAASLSSFRCFLTY